MAYLTPAQWDTLLSARSEAHLLQTAAWGQLKAAFGWQVQSIWAEPCGAQVLFRRLPLGLCMAYVPKGPVGNTWSVLWPEIDALCRRRHALLLKVEPDVWEPVTTEITAQLKGFVPSPQTIQPPRTILVNLEGDEEALLARMKQKTRYNIRLAQKKDVVVRPSNDIPAFHRLMALTGQRDGFGTHSLEYYQEAYRLFSAEGKCQLLVAEAQGQSLAALMVFRHGRRAWYLYGASTDQERNRMPTYLLQWEAMRWAQAQGCLEYDLWGIPDYDEALLEAQFSERSDGLWGVYRFKRGFGGQVMRSAGAWDKVYQPLWYTFYRWYTRHRRSTE